MRLFLFHLFDKVNFKMKMNDEMMLGSGGGRNNWALACTLRVGTKGKCRSTWPCQLL